MARARKGGFEKQKALPADVSENFTHYHPKNASVTHHTCRARSVKRSTNKNVRTPFVIFAVGGNCFMVGVPFRPLFLTALHLRTHMRIR